MIALAVLTVLVVVIVRRKRRKAVVRRQETPLAGRDTGTRHIKRQPCRTNQGY